jgi:lipopolysaccharide heptosyltransferase I
MPQSFLIVRLGALGDIVHATPLVAAIAARWPDARIDWVVERKHRAVLDLVTGLHQVVEFASRRLGGGPGWAGTVRRLRAARYDVVFDAQGLLKSATLARAAGGARTVGFASGALREPAARAFYSEVIHPAGATHVVEKNLALLRAVGIEAPDVRFPLRRDPESAAVRDAIEAAGAGFAVLNPGGGWPNKRWPPDRFGAVAAELARRHGLPSLVLWGPGDERLADAAVAASGGAARRAPRTTVADMVALVRRARLLVSGDTGPLHLAAAVGTPIVGIYGPTDPARNGPLSTGDLWVSRHDVCECYHLRKCRAARWCLETIAVDEVVQAIDRRLAPADAGAHGGEGEAGASRGRDTAGDGTHGAGGEAR